MASLRRTYSFQVTPGMTMRCSPSLAGSVAEPGAGRLLRVAMPLQRNTDTRSTGGSPASAPRQAASIDTETKNRDDDLRSKNFFEVDKNPRITFASPIAGHPRVAVAGRLLGAGQVF